MESTIHEIQIMEILFRSYWLRFTNNKICVQKIVHLTRLLRSLMSRVPNTFGARSETIPSMLQNLSEQIPVTPPFEQG